MDELHQSALDLYLFPNRTKQYDEHGRLLSFENDKYTETVPCEICAGLTTCTGLNGLLIQEVYYPSMPGTLGTCKILDQRGVRFGLQIFGPDNTFRDTPVCRDIVMQYLCLFWASDNTMYTNFCVYQEDVSNPDPQKHKIAPRPPCRSFCVQVAYICANDPITFNQQCANVVCNAQVSDTCTPDPQLKGGENE
jgi:hypothetical protein